MLSLFCMIVQGQTHMKFMGIPLNGNVELFTQKLKAKGLTCDVAKTKASPSGVKIYKGLFMGEDSEFMIFFNPKDKMCLQWKFLWIILLWSWLKRHLLIF